MAHIDTLTMYDELIEAGSSAELARAIVLLMNEMRREYDAKIDALNDKLNRR